MKLRQSLCALALGLLSSASLHAQRHHEHHEHHQAEASQPCYDQYDPNDIRLWDGPAPGAAGNDPCRDIPFMRIYPSGVPNSPAILVIPGGGYDKLKDVEEQGPVGQYFSQQLHVTTFVLYYRLVQANGTYRYPVPMWDGQRALRMMRYRAAQFGISPEEIGMFGFSAGGHLAATLALHAGSDFNLPQHDAVDSMKAHVRFLGLGYPVISMDPSQFASQNSFDHLLYGYHGRDLEQMEHYLSAQENVTPHTVPVFLFESMDDARISPQNAIMFGQALRSAGVPLDEHIFQHGKHGSGLSVGIPEEQEWPGFFAQWLTAQVGPR